MATSSLNRFTLLLDKAAMDTVDRLQATYGRKNKAEVYDLAIRVLTWATEQQIKGYEFGRYKDDVFQPLHLPYTLNAQAWREAEKTD